MSSAVPIQRALISVSNKTDLVAFARRLARRDVELISTGGTAKVLAAAGLKVRTVDQITGFPEMMDGRVKTLHPKIHGALLALRDNKAHVQAMRGAGIEPIDLVCVNLYPFEQTIAKESVAEAEAIEQIDIGGPSMIRSAAKNHAFVAVVTDPAQYDRVCHDIEQNDGATSLALRRWLAAAAFARTAAYDSAIAAWMVRSDPHLAELGQTPFPGALVLRLNRQAQLRYGENPHQLGALYVEPGSREPSVAQARQLHGKTLSFCNLYDANGALELVKEIDANQHAAAAVIKHANPCGFAVSDQMAEAFEAAHQGDPLAAFGGIVACNRVIDLATAEKIAAVENFLEVIVAPGFNADATAVLQQRWKNTRLLDVGPLPAARDARELDFKRITGGLLVQQRDLAPFEPRTWQHAAGPPPDDQTLADAAVAMIAVKHIKSNAVCLVANRALVGAGAGQMDRLASCRIAIQKADARARGAVAGSDAFFPFRDGPDELLAAGVRAIAQPGGSKRDDETIAACNEANVTMLFTGRRLFRH